MKITIPSLICLFFTVVQLNAQDLVIIHTNDLHASMYGSSPELEYTPLINDNDPTMGGFARIAGFIDSQKKINKNKLLVLDAGDYTMGTLFQTLEKDECFELNLLEKMGYDFIGIGNHEFDFGQKGLAEMISKSKANGKIPQILCANYKNQKDGSDSSLLKLFNDGTILPYSIVMKNGFKIGIFGIIGQNADEAMPDLYDVDFIDAKKCAQKTSFYLKEKEKVDLVIGLSHGYLYKNKKGEFVGEDIELAKSCQNIDLLVSGHSHTLLPKLIKEGNVSIVQTGSLGKYVGQIEVNFNKSSSPSVSYILVPMDDNIKANAEIQKLIEEKEPVIEDRILSSLGMKFKKPVFETSFDVLCDTKNASKSNLGPLISDAIYGYLNNTLDEKIDFYVVATGVIRHDIVKGKQGKQNVNDIFNIMPLGEGNDNIPGSPIGKIYITGNELKKVMELIFAVYPSNDDYYLFFTGMKIKCDLEKGLFKKISEIQIGTEEKGYKNVSFSKKDNTLYCVAANKYILGFISGLKKMSYGIVNVIGKNADGSVIKDGKYLIDKNLVSPGIQEVREWIVLYEYFGMMPDLNGNGIPDVPDIYKSKLNPIIEAKK